MSELAHAMKMLGNLPLSLIKFPSGKWGFVGHVPTELRFEYSDPKYLRTASDFGVGIAASIATREGGYIRTRTWESETAARMTASELGFSVS